MTILLSTESIQGIEGGIVISHPQKCLGLSGHVEPILLIGVISNQKSRLYTPEAYATSNSSSIDTTLLKMTTRCYILRLILFQIEASVDNYERHKVVPANRSSHNS